jgi:hypothetical protein
MGYLLMYLLLILKEALIFNIKIETSWLISQIILIKNFVKL